jgi:hypothetical protein
LRLALSKGTNSRGGGGGGQQFSVFLS